MKCNNCRKEINKGDKYIKIEDLETRYCNECFSTDTTTIYYVDGEYVGSDNEVEEYDIYDSEED